MKVEGKNTIFIPIIILAEPDAERFKKIGQIVIIMLNASNTY